MVCSCNACFSYANSIDFVLTCLVTRPLLANSACAVNLLEESGTLFSYPASRPKHNCHTTPTFGVVIARLYVQNVAHFVSIISEIRSIIWEFWHNFGIIWPLLAAQSAKASNFQNWMIGVGYSFLHRGPTQSDV